MEPPPFFFSKFTMLYVMLDKAAIISIFKGLFGSVSLGLMVAIGTSHLSVRPSRVRSSILIICRRYSAIVSNVARYDLDP